MSSMARRANDLNRRWPKREAIRTISSVQRETRNADSGGNDAAAAQMGCSDRLLDEDLHVGASRVCVCERSAPLPASHHQHHLRDLLHRLDGKGYGAYKDIRGSYVFDDFTLFVDHVQGDPFAAPSRLRLQVSQAIARYPERAYRTPARGAAVCTYLATRFSDAAAAASTRNGSGKSGLIDIDRPGQQVLPRTCLSMDADRVEARFCVGLPAAGRRIRGPAAAEILCERIPDITSATLFFDNDDPAVVDRFAEVGEDAAILREQLEGRGLVAFVADDSILPRRSGVDDRPLEGNDVVPFHSPPELAVHVDLPNRGTVRGMGIPAGVTLTVGGGFHGKSTLLNALERGVYNHIPGDGRELAVTEPTAVKIRAEDGRPIQGVDVSAFIRDLPFGRDTRVFTTDNASGSTSQAANIVEALEAGTRLLLVDEDTAAANFMIRDGRMQRLIARADEPITPFIDRVRQLYDEHGVSTVLVMGGSGDYFGVADTVIAMESYAPRDATGQARAIAADSENDRSSESEGPFGRVAKRVPLPDSIETRKERRETSVRTRGSALIEVGTETVDLSAIEQIVDPSQTRALAAALVYARDHYMGPGVSLREVLDRVMADIDRAGLDVLNPHFPGDQAAFRRLELAAIINRLPTLRVQQVR